MKPEQIIPVDNIDDVKLFNLSIGLAYYYKKLSEGNVTTWINKYFDQWDGFNFECVAVCKECKFTFRIRLKPDNSIIITEIEEFCKDHRHVAALDKETSGGN